ncbi:MAG: SDR family oxidoreductase [Lentisphaerae bacterium]|nr:SDR family oxidoreductase [Lentisphaerota bacterium]
MLSLELDFTGKVAIVTGAASGMGLLSAQNLAAGGAKVVLTDVNDEALQAAVAGICAKGGQALGRLCDVRDYSQVEAAAKFTVEQYGRIDILINCAGGFAGRIFQRKESFKDMPLEVLDWGMDVNFKGPIYFCRAVLNQMFEQKRGVIINLGSVDGVTGSSSMEYSAAKGGMISLTKSLAVYASPHGVRACCVSPGPVLTRAAMANMPTRLGRAAEPQELVDMIVFLCSDKAAFANGSNFVVDGGRSCGGYKN